MSEVENVGCSGKRAWRPPSNSGVQVSAGGAFYESKGGGALAVDDAPRDIQLFGYERVCAETRVVNATASGFVAIDKTVVAKTAEALQE